MYQLPHYINRNHINSQFINYIWDDSDVESFLDYSYANDVIERIDQISIRAKIALIIGVYEWGLGRFEGLCNNQIPFKIAEMAWCANINKEYTFYFDIDRADYLGPINAPLWCSFYFLIPTLYVSENIGIDSSEASDVLGYDTEAWIDALLNTISVTLHILPPEKVDIFKTWLEGVIERLIEFYTMPEEDPFANLFGHKNEKEWLGDYVAREVLDLDYNYNPKDAIRLCDNYLQTVDYKNNPFLQPPEKLKNRIKTPYRLMTG